MSSTDKLVIPAYKQSSEREFNEWFRNLRTAAKQHKYLLDIIEVGTIRPGAEREAEVLAMRVRYKSAGETDDIPAKIDKYFENQAVSLSRQLYGGLQNAVKDDDTLAEMLADEDADHYDDIKKGIAAIKSLIESEDTNSKNVRTKALRADLEKAYSPDALKDLTSASLAKFKTGIELANKFLKGSQWHLPDEVIEEYILDAIAAKGATLGANMRVQIGMQRQLAEHSNKTYGLKASARDAGHPRPRQRGPRQRGQGGCAGGVRGGDCLARRAQGGARGRQVPGRRSPGADQVRQGRRGPRRPRSRWAQAVPPLQRVARWQVHR